MKVMEAVAGVIIGVLGSAVFEWAIKPPIEKVTPAINSIIVSLEDFSNSVVQNSANYSENFTGLLLLSSMFIFSFKVVSAFVSGLDFGRSRFRQVSITRAFNIGAEIFVIFLSVVSVYAGLLVHERTTWFSANMTRLEAKASWDDNAPIRFPDLNALRAEWTEMRTPADLKMIVSKVQALGARADVHIAPVAWSD